MIYLPTYVYLYYLVLQYDKEIWGERAKRYGKVRYGMARYSNWQNDDDIMITANDQISGGWVSVL